MSCNPVATHVKMAEVCPQWLELTRAPTDRIGRPLTSTRVAAVVRRLVGNDSGTSKVCPRSPPFVLTRTYRLSQYVG